MEQSVSLSKLRKAQSQELWGLLDDARNLERKLKVTLDTTGRRYGTGLKCETLTRAIMAQRRVIRALSMFIGVSDPQPDQT
jgi:hypothetical protein